MNPQLLGRAAAMSGIVSTALVLTCLSPISTAAGTAPAPVSSAAAATPKWAVVGSSNYAVPASALHVSTKGSDTAPGTKTRPLKTISAAIKKAKTGGTIVVGSGTYHETLTLNGARSLKIQPARNATVWLDGSRAVSNWTKSGNAWVSTGWTPEFNSSPTYSWDEPDNSEASWQFINKSYPMAAHPDQVWINASAQRQVKTLAQVKAGTFYVDYAADKLYVGSNPTGHQVRASDIAKAISVRASGTVIRGIGVRRYAPSVPHMGAVTVEEPNVRLENMVIRDNATTGLHVMRKGIKLDRVTLAYNGMMGMTGTHSDGLTVNAANVTGNNRERFNPSPSAGGAKFGRLTGILVRNSRFANNYGTGLWFDESIYNFGVYRSQMINNTRHGVSLEISGKAVVAGNVIAGNDGNGIKVNDTNIVNIWNNTIVGNGRPINIVQDNRDVSPGGSYRDRSLPLTFRNGPVTIRNNIIAKPASSANCMLCVEDFSGRWTAAQFKVASRGNVYQRTTTRSPSWLVVWSRGAANPDVFGSIEAFRKKTKQETPGRMLTGTVAVSAGYKATKAVRALTRTTAQPLPAWLASRLGRKTGERHLGAW